MKNARINYVLPTLREDDTELEPEDISGVEISLSADGGEDFMVLDTQPPDVLSIQQNDMDIGLWIARLIVIDDEGHRGQPFDKPFVIKSDSPPGTVTDVTVDLSAS